jgi:hypothetical protein
VPIGQDLPKKDGKAPTFAVWAQKDPDSPNLDRIQIVKGWCDKRGYGFEKIYDVVWSDGRKVDEKTGKLPAVGNTVSIKKATYTNDIGDSELSAVSLSLGRETSRNFKFFVGHLFRFDLGGF